MSLSTLSLITAIIVSYGSLTPPRFHQSPFESSKGPLLKTWVAADLTVRSLVCSFGKFRSEARKLSDKVLPQIKLQRRRETSSGKRFAALDSLRRSFCCFWSHGSSSGSGRGRGRGRGSGSGSGTGRGSGSQVLNNRLWHKFTKMFTKRRGNSIAQRYLLIQPSWVHSLFRCT